MCGEQPGEGQCLVTSFSWSLLLCCPLQQSVPLSRCSPDLENNQKSKLRIYVLCKPGAMRISFFLDLENYKNDNKMRLSLESPSCLILRNVSSFPVSMFLIIERAWREN